MRSAREAQRELRSADLKKVVVGIKKSSCSQYVVTPLLVVFFVKNPLMRMKNNTYSYHGILLSCPSPQKAKTPRLPCVTRVARGGDVTCAERGGDREIERASDGSAEAVRARQAETRLRGLQPLPA